MNVRGGARNESNSNFRRLFLGLVPAAESQYGGLVQCLDSWTQRKGNLKMNGYKWIGLSAVLLPTLAGVVSGCGTDAGSPQEDVNVKVGGPGSDAAQVSEDAPEVLGNYHGVVRNGQIHITPAEDSTGGIKTQGFVELDYSRFDITDAANAIAVNSSCPANWGPNYYSSAHAFPGDGKNGPTCQDHTLCGLVKIKNNTTRKITNLYAEVTTITTGFSATNSANPNAVGPGYNLSNAYGLWRYGTLNAGGAKNVQWNFNLPNCTDFEFDFRLKGTLTHTSYDSSGDMLDTGEFLDACTLGGTHILRNSAATGHVDGLSLPFPFNIYDSTIDAKSNKNLSISAAGALGWSDGTTGVTNGSNSGFPTGHDYTAFPFWDSLTMSNQGVCYTTIGTAPNQSFVVTWKNATIDNATAPQNKITFSAVLHEGTDDIEFQYNSCFGNGAANLQRRGSGATVGIEGFDANGNRVYTNVSTNAAFIPTTASGECGADGWGVTLSAQAPSTL